MDLVDLVLLLLAGARLTILVVYDEITEPLRDVIFHFSPPENDTQTGRFYQNYWPATRRERAEYKRKGVGVWRRRWSFHSEENRPVGFFGSALSCPDCTGVWVGLALTLAYVLYPEETVAVSTVFAIAMIASWIPRKGQYR